MLLDLLRERSYLSLPRFGSVDCGTATGSNMFRTLIIAFEAFPQPQTQPFFRVIKNFHNQDTRTSVESDVYLLWTPTLLAATRVTGSGK